MFVRLFFLRPRHVAYGILVPRPGIEPMPPALGAWSLNHWTAREVPVRLFLTEQKLLESKGHDYSICKRAS